MPTYNFQCSCGFGFERLLRISQSDEPQNCPECANVAERVFTPPEGGFILSGDGWAGKNIRISGQMREKNKRLDQKQNEYKRDAPGIQLAPNVGGERVDSWSEASKLAASKGKDTSGYDARARKEK